MPVCSSLAPSLPPPLSLCLKSVSDMPASICLVRDFVCGIIFSPSVLPILDWYHYGLEKHVVFYNLTARQLESVQDIRTGFHLFPVCFITQARGRYRCSERPYLILISDYVPTEPKVKQYDSRSMLIYD